MSSTLARAQSITDHPRVVEALNLVEVWLAAQRDYHDIPGISAGVVYDQDLIWSEGFGYANLESRTPATPSTMYSICSISKLFTSVSVMQLRDMGKFRLDDEVGSLLPWFDLEQSYTGGAPITLEGILTHSAGLPRESDYPYWSDPFDFPTHDAVVARLSSQETLYPAWKYFQYSNLGLTLAGEIVSETSGQSFGDYIRGHILEPLGMTSTVPEIGEAWDNPKMATGYSATRRDGDRKKVKPFAGRGIAPAMGFASTVEDLARFASWQFRLLEKGGHEILETNTLREMHRVHWVDPSWETTWGLGFSISRRDDKTFVGHGGGCPGFLTRFQIQPDEKIATIAMVNANGTNPGLLARRAYEIVAPALETAQDSADQGKPLAAELEKYVGAYDGFPWGGESAVIPWKGDLAAVSLPTDNPLEAMMKLKHVEGNRFRRIRDDETLGEEIVFETDANGNVVRMWQHSNASERMRR
jgi:CubicO group peptidase (beta-lactamase class C family)